MSLAKKRTKCEICEEGFEYYVSNRGENPRTCSYQCRSELMRQKPKKGDFENCKYCNDLVYVAPWEYEWKDTFFCDTDCKAEWQSENVKGDNHPSWKGGWEHYYGEDWNEQRKKAWERDDYQCRICGKSEEELGRKPDVHHIIPVRTYRNEYGDRNLAHSLDNLITLCSTHHHEVEQGSRKIPLLEISQNVCL